MDMHRNDEFGKSQDHLFGFLTLKLSRRNAIGMLSFNKVIRFRDTSKSVGGKAKKYCDGFHLFGYNAL